MENLAPTRTEQDINSTLPLLNDSKTTEADPYSGRVPDFRDTKKLSSTANHSDVIEEHLDTSIEEALRRKASGKSQSSSRRIVGKKNCCSGPAETLRSYKSGLKQFCGELKTLTSGIDVKSWAKNCCSLKTVKGKLPILSWAPKYRLKHFQGDMIAGLTVGLTVIPQGLAYAIVAGLSPEYGLYSAFMGCFLYIFFGTSKDITLGPTAIMSLLTEEFGKSPVTEDPTYAILLSLVCGVIQLAMGILKIGFLVEFISHPVINAFTTAAAITIGWGQVKKWLGLKDIPNDLIQDVYWTLRKIPQTKLWDFLLGLGCIIALYIMKRLRDVKWGDVKQMSRAKRIFKYVVWLLVTARNAVVVVIASGVAAGFLQNDLRPFSLTGNITSGLPPFKPPSLTLTVSDNTTMSAGEVFSDISVGFPIVALLGVIETVAIGKSFARKNGYDIDADQELLAIGASNILNSFVGGYPVTGSFSRTAVNAHSGVMTPAGGLWTAALVLLSLSFLTPLFYYIPKSALAAVIIMAVVDMVDFTLLPQLWRIKKIDLVPWIITFICCLLIGIEWGIIIGVGLSLLLLLYPWIRPHVKVGKEGLDSSDDSYLILTVDQGLLFPGMDHFSEKVSKKAFADKKSRSVIIDMFSVANADFTTVETFHHLIDDFVKQKQHIILCNLRPNILDIFTRAKLKHFEHTDSVEEAVKILKELKASNGISAAVAADMVVHVDDEAEHGMDLEKAEEGQADFIEYSSNTTKAEENGATQIPARL